MSNEEKTKTWQRTKTPGLLRHKGGTFYARLHFAGKSEFRSLHTDLLEVARTRFAEQKAQVENATRRAVAAAGRGSATMGDLADLYRQKVSGRPDLGERTRKIYLEHVDFLEKTWPGFRAIRPAEVTRSAVEAWRDRVLSVGTGFRPPGAKEASEKTAGRSAGRFNKVVDALRRMIDMAVEAGALHANVIAGRGIKASDRPKKPQLPDVAKLHEVFAEIERSGALGGWAVEVADFCRFLLVTGCRKSEAGAVVWADVDDGRGVLRVRGTKSAAAEREVPLSRAARELLAKIRARRPAEPAERVLAVREAQRSLDRACAKVGVTRLTHHDLRDGFATTCIESGVDVPTVAAWLGHADGGALLMRVYAHHRRAHSLSQMERVSF